MHANRGLYTGVGILEYHLDAEDCPVACKVLIQVQLVRLGWQILDVDGGRLLWAAIRLLSAHCLRLHMHFSISTHLNCQVPAQYLCSA